MKIERTDSIAFYPIHHIIIFFSVFSCPPQTTMALRDISKPKNIRDGSQPSQSGSERGRQTRSRPGPLLGQSIINDGRRGKPSIIDEDSSLHKQTDDSPCATMTPGPSSTARDPRPHHGLSPSDQSNSATRKFESIMADLEKKVNPELIPLPTGSRHGRTNDF